MTRKAVFTDIYKTNAWNSQETVSGPGSTVDATRLVRQGVAAIVANYDVRSVVDLGCGDCNWMRRVSLDIPYVGVDVVAEIVESNQRQLGSSGRRFVCADAVHDAIPRAALIIARDCLVHLHVDDVFRAIGNMKNSGARWLLTTTFPAHHRNHVIESGDWSPYNLTLAPFNFPEPVEVINEDCREYYPDFQDKSLALWRVSDLPPVPNERGTAWPHSRRRVRADRIPRAAQIKAIVVCVDYEPLLAVTLPRNKQHFAETLVVTAPHDEKTKRLAEAHGCRVHVTDAFYRFGAAFNKGLAIEEAFDILGRSGWFCVWDADIVLPRNAKVRGLDRRCLHVPLRRILSAPQDFHDDLDWQSLNSPTQPNEHDGYCQIFHASVLPTRPWYGTTWNHAGGCDSEFALKFPEKRRTRPSFEVLHLGCEGVDRIGDNWLGKSGKHDINEFRARRRSVGTQGEHVCPVMPPLVVSEPSEAADGEFARVMRFYWHGRMSFMRYLTLLSFRTFHPDWVIELYSPALPDVYADVPWTSGERDDRGYQGEDYRARVSEIGVICKAYPANPDLSPAQNSDLFQWKILAGESGFYSDMDILWLQSLESLRQQHREHDALFCLENGYLAIGFFGSHRCEVFQGIYDQAVGCDRRSYQAYGVEAVYQRAGTWSERASERGGSQTLRALARKHPAASIGEVPSSTVYPFDWREIAQIFESTCVLPNTTVGLHWFGGSDIAQQWSQRLTEGSWFRYPNTFTRSMERLL